MSAGSNGRIHVDPGDRPGSVLADDLAPAANPATPADGTGPRGPDRPPSPAGAPSPTPLRRLTSRQWRQLTLMAVILVLLGCAGGFGASALVPTRYAAQADVLYMLTREQATGFLREDRNITTQIVLMTSRTVLAPVAAEVGVPVEDLAASVQAAVLDESEVIHVELTDSDPARAQRLLEQILVRYIDISNNDERSRMRDYLESELTIVLERIKEVRGLGQARQLELAPLVDREQSIRTQLDDFRLTDLAGPAAQVLVAPYTSTEPVSPKPLVATATGAAGGLVVALLVLAVLARRMTRNP
ncbi:MAG: hypothetical protein AVDCRST_MAG66-3429 [uncultured Pseudonocardia sp.]|uniref:Polysaccharide chain length determinant N-terminal domain-containing protein n=1 Tax=uncultured Pseudonocardia sp. TaxID=211455 RepID=A0A6J4QAT0_9PSEU|nr:MAG: hypothetical protein AVDCRST_MAG66-3429 [uncultured Pseudonocardia sp.]